jgi:hypothetical protein
MAERDSHPAARASSAPTIDRIIPVGTTAVQPTRA